MQFNRERAAPDVSQEENSHTYTVTSLPTETGFRYATDTDYLPGAFDSAVLDSTQTFGRKR